MDWIKYGWLLAVVAYGCNGKLVDSQESEESLESRAIWIQDSRPLPDQDSLFYLDQPAPLFRKEFNSTEKIKEAKLLITAAGYYKAWINGNVVGKNVLDPVWTDYSKRIYYTEYDVTSLLNAGNNCLGITLGNGFYNPLPLRKWGQRNLRTDLDKVGKPAFIAKLILNFENGSSQEIITDTSWRFTYGPLLKNDVYLGVTYDAGREADGWQMPEFDDSSWDHSLQGGDPGGQLQKAFFPPIQVTQEINPKTIYSPAPGIWMVDMGINFTGTYRIKISGQTGDTISMRFGERIYEDGTLNPMTTVAGQIKRKGMGGPGAPDIAWQEDDYIIGEPGEAWFTPEFTYHTYRYMEIRGLASQPLQEDIRGLFIHSNVKNDNHFSTASPLLNSIQEITERTFLANLVGVQSDCPAREKFGYGGDLNATSEAFIYNFDMQAFYRKTLYDWMDAMNDTLFVDTAPFVGINYCGLSWESAFLITQYYLYLYYGDLDLVKELYAADIQWMQKVARIHPEGWVDEGLSDHESLAPVPVKLTGTCHYLQCARIMISFAELMGDERNKEQYENLAARLQKMIRDEYWDKPVADEINRQTLFATLLYHEVIPADQVTAAVDSLRQAVAEAPSGHFITGIFGTKYVLEALSRYGSPQEVYDIVNSTAYPGWGYMIDQGATTVWETWKESDNTYSNCHPMFGSVTEWFYRWLGGIQADPGHPGFKTFVLAPYMPEGLDSVSCTYHAPHGPITSKWQREEGDHYRYEVSIPEGSSAQVILPKGHAKITRIRDLMENKDLDPMEGMETGRVKLAAGRYLLAISPDH